MCWGSLQVSEDRRFPEDQDTGYWRVAECRVWDRPGRMMNDLDARIVERAVETREGLMRMMMEEALDS